jgi:hypothetical protein
VIAPSAGPCSRAASVPPRCRQCHVIAEPDLATALNHRRRDRGTARTRTSPASRRCRVREPPDGWHPANGPRPCRSPSPPQRGSAVSGSGSPPAGRSRSPGRWTSMRRFAPGFRSSTAARRAGGGFQAQVDAPVPECRGKAGNCEGNPSFAFLENACEGPAKPANLADTDHTTENRGVPGSSPGLAIAESPLCSLGLLAVGV